MITTDLTVRIKNTGKYFYSIKEALDHAVSGNTVMVSAKSTPYIESLIVPPGVHLVGSMILSSGFMILKKIIQRLLKQKQHFRIKPLF